MTNQPTGHYGGPPPSGPPPYAPPAYPPRRPRKGASVVVALLMTVLFGISALVNLVLLVAVAGGSDDNIVETSLSGVGDDPADGPGKIAVIPLYGPIMGGPVDASYAVDPVDVFMDKLEAARTDVDVKAIVIEIDSPGGSVSAFDRIYSAILAFKKSKKPVVISMGSVAASGGYYASVAGDYIYAEPTTLTGSIGVILMRYDVSGALEYIRIKDASITSGKNKGSLSGTKPINDAQRRILQEIVNDAYRLFLQRIEVGRGGKLSVDDDFRNNVADGRIFTAEQARGHGLIDEIGGLGSAVEKARYLADAPNAEAVRYIRKASPFETLFQGVAGDSTRAGVSIDVGKALEEFRTPRMMYLWRGE